MPSREPQTIPGKGALAEMDRQLGEKVSGSAATVPDFASWISAAIRRADLAEAGERLKRARARWAAIDWAPLEVDLLMMGRDYQRASALMATSLLAVRNPQEAAHLTDLKSHADLMKSITDRIRAHDRQGSDDLTVYAINLDENPDRWDRISRLAHPRPLRRVAGVPGRYLADGVMKRFGPQVSPGFKGTLGCFLAHYAAWEAHVKSGEAHALVLEDDGLPLVDIPLSGAALALPEGFDICFLTTSLGRVAISALPPDGGLLYQPIAAVIRALARGLEAPGAYGYVLSRRGAEQLVARVDADGFYGDVDWRMIAYCVTGDELAHYPRESFAHAALTGHMRVLGARPPLKGFVCQPGLVSPGRLGSVRERDNSLRHAHLWLDADGSR